MGTLWLRGQRRWFARNFTHSSCFARIFPTVLPEFGRAVAPPPPLAPWHPCLFISKLNKFDFVCEGKAPTPTVATNATFLTLLATAMRTLQSVCSPADEPILVVSINQPTNQSTNQSINQSMFSALSLIYVSESIFIQGRRINFTTRSVNVRYKYIHLCESRINGTIL